MVCVCVYLSNLFHHVVGIHGTGRFHGPREPERSRLDLRAARAAYRTRRHVTAARCRCSRRRRSCTHTTRV